MKPILLAILLFASASSFAQAPDADPTVVTVYRAETTDVSYLQSIEGSVMTPGSVWYGSKLVGLSDGTCQQIDRGGFILELSAAGTQVPKFKETKVAVDCPAKDVREAHRASIR